MHSPPCLLAIITVSVAFVAGNFTRHTCVIPTSPASDQKPAPSCSSCPNSRSLNVNDTQQYDDTQRCLTLNELSISRALQSQEEVVLLTGIHVINGTSRRNLKASGVGDLSIRGESDKVVIKCLRRFAFWFSKCNHVNITNITFINCMGLNSNKYTLLFLQQQSSIVLNWIQIISQRGAGVGVYMSGSMGKPHSVCVSLINSKLFTFKMGLYVGYSTFLWGSHFRVYVENTSFVDTCLLFSAKTNNIKYYYGEYNITLKNITIEQCSCRSALTLLGARDINRFNVMLQDVNMKDNTSPNTIYANQTSIYLRGSNLFHRNRGDLYLEHCNLIVSWTVVEFVNNTVLTSHGVPILATRSRVVIENSYVRFVENHGASCGGIMAKSQTQLNLKDNTTIMFEHNSGVMGGALSFHDESVMSFTTANNVNPILMKFQHNEARKGGAIFVEDSSYINTISRGLTTTLFRQTRHVGSNVQLWFSDNAAQIGGDSIYGGWVDWSVSENGSIIYNPNISSILLFKSTNKDIASDPVHVCLCTNGVPNCSITEHKMEIFGHAFSLSMLAVGQRFTPVIEYVEAKLQALPHALSERTIINVKQQLQIVQRFCTTLQYSLIQPNAEEVINIYPLSKVNSPRFTSILTQNNADYDLLFQQLSVLLKIKHCPLGFTLHKTSGSCVCRESLMSIGLKCHLDTYRINRRRQQWVGVTEFHTANGEYPGIIAHPHCPFDYCRTGDDSLLVRLEDPDELCTFNRSGILCGSCQTDLSLVLGSSRCKKCTNITTLMVFPTFLVVGLSLIIFLMLLNLTVSVGTINGLIFYANIIRAQHATFFTPDITHSFLSKFIAWLNLDQGIESCFFNGYNTYISTWLQFLFPLYIWLIAAALIVTSHYSTRVSKLIGRNAVQVLATLFLITYAKLLRLIIDVISFTTITYPDGYKKTVWLVDGNVEYFKGRHIPLVLVTVICILFSLPYTFILLSIQFLYKISHYRIMFWVQRLKPFFDAYTGPYRANHRYWTGLLLIARISLLVTFSVNQHNNLSINLLAIITVSVLLLGWLSSGHWVYESALNNFLEIIFLCNITITSVAVLFNLYNQRNSPVAIYLSTTVTLVIFVAIILYHALRQLQLTKFGSKLKVKLLSSLPPTLKHHIAAEMNLGGIHIKIQQPDRNFSVSYNPTSQDSPQGRCKPYNPHELKEPLLENQQESY